MYHCIIKLIFILCYLTYYNFFCKHYKHIDVEKPNFNFCFFFILGKFYALSSNTLLDIDNSAVFMPDGRLSLKVDKFLYQELGLPGTLSRHILRTPKEKYSKFFL